MNGSNIRGLRAKMSASEALFGFMAWLTARKEVVTFSEIHDAAPAADLVARFIETNNLSEPRDGWAKKLIHPKEN